jgi:hypothetical protein
VKSRRSQTLDPKALRRLVIREAQSDDGLELLYPRPRTRGECCDEPRPCPYVGCRYHLYLDVNEETGALKLNFPSLEPWELPDTCALDVADRKPHNLEAVAERLGVVRERVRQIEVRALVKLRVVGIDDPEPLHTSRQELFEEHSEPFGWAVEFRRQLIEAMKKRGIG